MSAQNGPEPRPETPAARPRLTSRALLIILTAIIVGVAVAAKPAVALPVGIGLAVATLLVEIFGD